MCTLITKTANRDNASLGKPLLRAVKHYVQSVTLLLLAGLSLSGTALAKPNLESCQTKRAQNIGYLQCIDSVLEDTKLELQTYLNARRNELIKLEQTTGRVDALKAFTRAQEHFEQFKEDNCRWRYLKLLPDSTAATIRFKECELMLIGKRIDDLQQLQ